MRAAAGTAAIDDTPHHLEGDAGVRERQRLPAAAEHERVAAPAARQARRPSSTGAFPPFLRETSRGQSASAGASSTMPAATSTSWTGASQAQESARAW
jgi:hypothetical protein